jgi:cellulose synthase/poly-beta-1,6-N-acetylglucosamine synthase-like glycosyltransferase
MKNAVAENNMKKPQLSVVIIGRNEGQRLIECIRSVQAMNDSPENMEIIYVDSDSNDGSPERAEVLGVRVLVVHPERPAAAIGRNAGWRAAVAPVVLFLDGDTILNRDFVKTALPYFDNPKMAAVCGHRREIDPNASIYQRALDLDWIIPAGVSEFCGGDVLIRRSVLEEIEGYDPKLIAGEDPEVCQRIRARGYIVHRLDQQMTLHDLSIRHWSQYWQRTIRTGHAYAEVSTLLRNTTTPLWQRESRKNFFHASALMGIFMVGFIIALLLKSLTPLLLSVALFLLLSVRTAIKARWKSTDPVTLLLYGLHSQFQHIPIALGQLSYYYHRWRGQHRRLIEYK